jgi:hypothetical protein
MQDQRAGRTQPGQEAATDRAHIDQWKWIQQAVTVAQAGAVEMRPADRGPVVVAARDAFRYALGAGGPADREDVVGRDAGRALQLIGTGAALRECHAAWSRAAAQQQYGTAVLHLRASQRDDMAQFMTPVLHRYRAQHQAEARGRQVQDDELDDVRQLRNDDIALAQALVQQRRREGVDPGVEAGVTQARRLTAHELAAVRRIQHGEPLRDARGVCREQVMDRRVAPPAGRAEARDQFRRRSLHAASLVVPNRPRNRPRPAFRFALA